MHAILNRPSRVLHIAAAMFRLVAFDSAANADIFQWEYISPADPSQGKQQSTTLAPDGAGVDAVPGAYIEDRDLTMAFLMNADVRNAYFIRSTLKDAEFSGANLANTKFGDVDLSGASFRETMLSNALFGFSHGDAVSVQRFAKLTEADFTDADLSNAGFYGATLTRADFTRAEVRGASFSKSFVAFLCDPIGDGLCSWIPVGTGITPAQLYSTASYQAHDLSGIDFNNNYLEGANFVGQNLTHASFYGAALNGVDFTAATVREADFSKVQYNTIDLAGITLAQLYSTASYQAADLSGIGLGYHILAGGNFSGQNLTNAYFYAATLTGADLSAADVRGSIALDAWDATTANFIWPDGHIVTLELDAVGLLVVRDYDGNLALGTGPIAITVDQHLAMAPGGKLQMVFEADAWNSTISFAAGIPVALGGTLELTFADDVNLASQIGRVFDLFDWTGVNPTGTFAISSPYRWDLSKLYTSGEVTLTAIPEPSAVLLLTLGLATVLSACRAIRFNRSSLLPIAAAMFLCAACAGGARADIYQWEYIDPADPSQGKQQSTTLAPGGAGVDAVPGAYLSHRNLTTAYLAGADLTGAIARYANLTNAYLSYANLTGAIGEYAILTNADLSQANLTNVDFLGAVLTGANFTGAEVRGTKLHGTGITFAQLYSTASYQAHDLTGINLGDTDLSNWNFGGQNLTDAYFYRATLTGADFSGAEVRGAVFSDSGENGITFAQLYSTASYQAHDLIGITVNGDLSGWNFGGQNLTNANFYGATLSGVDISGAEVRGAVFGNSEGTGITLTQIYSTASYQAHELSGVGLTGTILVGGNFAGQNLTNSDFSYATLIGADFTGAEVRGAVFSTLGEIGITLAQLYSTASYQAHELSGVGLMGTILAGGNFAGQNLTGADFYGATLTGADFNGAQVQGACFSSTDLTLAQLYSTASYKARDLSGIDVRGSNFAGGSFANFAGGSFAGQNLANAVFDAATLTDANFTQANLTNASFGAANLTGANFREANLTNANFAVFHFCSFYSCGSGPSYFEYATLGNADLTAADARGASGLGYSLATTANFIKPDGHIDGLDLDAGDLLVVRDYDGNLPHIPITVDQHLTMGPDGTLRMVFEADAWDSTISFAPGIPVTLGGTLDLTFAPDVNLASQVGRTFDLFDWTGVSPTGAFAVSSPYAWDLSNLYTAGEVTLTAVPEPSRLLLLSFALAAFLAMRCTTLLRRSRVPQVAASASPSVVVATGPRPKFLNG